MTKKFFWLLAACGLSFALGAWVASDDTPKPLTAEVADVAARLFGIEFSPAERDSMLGYLNNQRSNYERLRKISLTNDVAPALLFDPRPAGFKMPTGPSRVQLTAARNRSRSGVPAGAVALPQNRDELAFFTVAQLGHLIETRQITSEELTRFFLDRLQKHSPALFNVVTLTEELALQQARRADAELKAGRYRGPLHGIPYGAKDLLTKEGYKTTWGSVPFKDQMLTGDATVIRRLEAAGAVLCAKLAVGELAMGDVWFGGMSRTRGSLKPDRAAPRRGRRLRWRPGCCRLPSALKRSAPSCRPAPYAVPPACGPPTAAYPAPARWRLAGAWTNLAR